MRSTIGHYKTSNFGLVWSYETGTSRGLEATPLIVDGVMYTTGSWSIVYAIDARTGKEIWKYDPKVEGKYGGRACCDVVNRGVAVFKGKVYFGMPRYNAIGAGVITDVRLSDEALFDEYEGILLDGDMIDSGMPSFKRWLTKQDVSDIRHYIATLRNALVEDER